MSEGGRTVRFMMFWQLTIDANWPASEKDQWTSLPPGFSGE